MTPPIQFALPDPTTGDHQWERLVDTAETGLQPHTLRRGIRYELKGRSSRAPALHKGF